MLNGSSARGKASQLQSIQTDINNPHTFQTVQACRCITVMSIEWRGPRMAGGTYVCSYIIWLAIAVNKSGHVTSWLQLDSQLQSHLIHARSNYMSKITIQLTMFQYSTTQTCELNSPQHLYNNPCSMTTLIIYIIVIYIAIASYIIYLVSQLANGNT